MVAFGIAAVAIARSDSDLSLAGDAVWASILQLAAGWSLVVAGVVNSRRHPKGRFGPLIVAAGAGWFLVEANNPEVESAIVFTTGLVLFAAAPPLVTHAALSYPGPRVGSRGELAVVVVGYVAVIGVLGLLAAALYDPAAQGCLQCPSNLVHVGGDAAAARDVARAGLWLLSIWAFATAVLLVVRAAPTVSVRRRLARPVLTAAAAYLVLVGLDAVHGIGRGFESNDVTDRRLWAGQAITLIALALGSGWERVRSARMRADLARLVVALDAAPASGPVRDALARALGDPDLVLVYPGGEQGWINARGEPAVLPGHLAVTELAVDSTIVAAVGHAQGALADADSVREITRVARPALEHERLEAQLRAQLCELRESRGRIVAASDAERRRLERDLHDGAQQRLVALALDLRLARRHLTRTMPESDEELAAAEEDLRLAVAELRALARGIHPPMLDDGGLGPALQALAEEAPRLTLGEIPSERVASPAESAAYQVVSETLRGSGGRVDVRARIADGRLLVELESDAVDRDALTSLEDRIGALGGSLASEAVNGHARLRAELPCA